MKSRNREQAINTKGIERRMMPVSELDNAMSACIYGPSGTGKTTLFGSFPGPKLLLDIKDKGTDSVSDLKDLTVLPCEDWLDIEQTYWFLKKNPKKFKSVGIDTITQLQEFAIRKVMEDSKREEGGLLTKKDWGEVSSLLKAWITNYRDLTDLGINVVFLAQQRIFNAGDEEDDNEITPEVGPRLMPSVSSTLCAAVSVIGSTFIREKKVKMKDKEKKIVVKKEREYCLRIGPHAYYTTKVRKPKKVEVPSYLVDPTYKQLVANL